MEQLETLTRKKQFPGSPCIYHVRRRDACTRERSYSRRINPQQSVTVEKAVRTSPPACSARKTMHDSCGAQLSAAVATRITLNYMRIIAIVYKRSRKRASATICTKGVESNVVLLQLVSEADSSTAFSHKHTLVWET